MSRIHNKLMTGYLSENVSHRDILFEPRLLPAGAAGSSLPFCDGASEA